MSMLNRFSLQLLQIFQFQITFRISFEAEKNEGKNGRKNPIKCENARDFSCITKAYLNQNGMQIESNQTRKNSRRRQRIEMNKQNAYNDKGTKREGNEKSSGDKNERKSMKEKTRNSNERNEKPDAADAIKNDNNKK